MSDNKVDNKLDFRNVKHSQFDPGQINKMTFSELQSSTRVYQTNAVLKDAYTHFIQTVDVEGRPTNVEYWQASDPAQDKLQFAADSGGSLAGKYFTLQGYLTKKTHVFWYRVSGSGTAPGIGDVETVIDISTNDPASVVCFATYQILKLEEEFHVIQKSHLSSFLTIEYNQFGETSAIDAGTSGFFSTRIKDGSSFQVGEVCLKYTVDGDPIYGGNTLKGLLFNPYTASFDVERDEVTATVDLDKPSSFTVTEIDFPLANTEVSINIPDGTKRYKIQARETNTKLTITDVSSGDYFTVRYGACHEANNIDTSGVTLYVTSSRANRTIELLTWS